MKYICKGCGKDAYCKLEVSEHPELRIDRKPEYCTFGGFKIKAKWEDET
jgi:hypothetical protein